MKRTIWTLAIAMFTIMAFSCQASNKPRTAQTPRGSITRQDLKNFSAIDVAGFMYIHYTQGDKYEVNISAPQYVINEIKAKTDNGKLIFSLDNKYQRLVNTEKKCVHIYVTSPKLKGVIMRGSGEFEAKGRVNANNLDLQIIGSGDIEMDNVTCNRINGKVTGSGDMDVKIKEAHEANWLLQGSGDIDIKQKNVEKTTAKLFGSGDIDIDFSNCDNVYCVLAGSGDIDLSGHIKNLEKEKSGSGDIKTKSLTIGK